MANLLVEVLNRMQLGEQVKSFGNSTGRIKGMAGVIILNQRPRCPCRLPAYQSTSLQDGGASKVSQCSWVLKNV